MSELKSHVTNSSQKVPRWYPLLAGVFLCGVLGQLLIAGGALFSNGELWKIHAIVGGALFFPASALLVATLYVPQLRTLRRWAGLTFFFYLVQVILAAGSTPLLLSVHPFNGALMLGASLALLAKVEYLRRDQSKPTEEPLSD